MERNWQSFAATTGVAVTRHSSKKERDHYKQERLAFIVRWVNTGFNKHFGTDTNNLDAWKIICETVGIEGGRDFSSISQCKKVRDEALKWNDGLTTTERLTICLGAEEILC
jgi:hypothetical protein